MHGPVSALPGSDSALHGADFVTHESDFVPHGVLKGIHDGIDYFGHFILDFLGSIGKSVGNIGSLDQGQVVHGISDSIEADVSVGLLHILAQEAHALSFGAAFGGDVDLNDILEGVYLVAELRIDLGGHPGGVLQALRMDTDLMDQSLGAVVHSGDNVVFSGIIHLFEDADIAFDVEGEAEIVGSVFFDNGIRHLRVHAFFADFLKLCVDNVGPAAGDVEVGLDKSCDEGGQAADLASGAESEEVSRRLILTDLGHVLGGELSVVLGKVEIQVPSKSLANTFFIYL